MGKAREMEYNLEKKLAELITVTGRTQGRTEEQRDIGVYMSKYMSKDQERQGHEDNVVKKACRILAFISYSIEYKMSNVMAQLYK